MWISQYRSVFLSPKSFPISDAGIGFYRYYIEDTLAIGMDSCIHLSFVPNNMQDMGFRGDLYILKDSTLHLRRCQLSIPKQSNVNFVESLQVLQEYEKLPDGQWVLTTDDMITEQDIPRTKEGSDRSRCTDA